MKKIAILFCAGLIAYSCAKVPLTGRNQLALVSNEEIQPMVNEQYDQVLKEEKVVTNTADGQKVLNVGKRMAEAVESYLTAQGYTDLANSFDWEFNLLQSDQVNAWCMPGGKVAFYTGIMPLTQGETGIAVVMGHEIAHAVASHSAERMSNGMIANLGVSVLSTAIGQNPTMTQQIFLQSVGMGSELGMLSFSRKHELEADELGLTFMAIAGYDPREAPLFWERMLANENGQAPPEFLSTHPASQTRIDKLNKHMSEAMKYYEGD
ncbi:M48 family metallopeptidase [Algoriphagus halophytocola]|uniref:M48 family metallopeptidase n=1 Tax=Algoriphagus halophytocola TaxID=2991499 RepID=A0ABY6MIY5_9BACT|nr:MULTISPECIES: M48 family metallopeptidase [unclassified Algoriphagus]UZD23598.1 M48 family metallopeptidase [Algoriphagus sp. TR-M5]WBL44891.1 M48 family metallopeptidase [Algoriphagus sp. TR-M9]